MSRGLGKVERAIIDYLVDNLSVYNLIIETRKDFFNPGCVYMGGTASVKQLVKHTGNSYKSLLRAINSLKRKKIVSKYKITTKNAKTKFEKELLKETKSNWVTMVKLSKLEKRIPYIEIKETIITDEGKKISKPTIKQEYIFHPHSKISKYSLFE